MSDKDNITFSFNEAGEFVAKVNGESTDASLFASIQTSTAATAATEAHKVYGAKSVLIEVLDVPQGPTGPVSLFHNQYLSVSGKPVFEVTAGDGSVFFSNFCIGQRASKLLLAGDTLTVKNHLFGVTTRIAVVAMPGRAPSPATYDDENEGGDEY